jgi:hypothetical protein
MNSIVRLLKTMLGLFFDDGTLALTLIGLLAALALLARGGLLASPGIAMGSLVGGTLLLLLENVVRTARRRSQ